MTGHKPWADIQHKKNVHEDDPDIIRQGNDVTILAPTAEVTIDLNQQEN